MTFQVSLCPTGSESTKTGFLTSQLKCVHYVLHCSCRYLFLIGDCPLDGVKISFLMDMPVCYPNTYNKKNTPGSVTNNKTAFSKYPETGYFPLENNKITDYSMAEKQLSSFNELRLPIYYILFTGIFTKFIQEIAG